MKKYKIVDTIFEIKFINQEYFDNRFETYETDGNIETDYYISFELVDYILSSKGILLEESKAGKKYQENNVIVDYLYKNDEITSRIIYNKNNYKIEIKKDLKNIKDREYLLSSLLFQEIMRKEKKIVIHASAISLNNQAILFSAPSGTGKSTQAILWIENFPECKYINDDKPVLAFEEDGIYVLGNPWSGKTDLNNNLKCKLKAIFYVQQSEENIVQTMSTFEKTHYTMLNMGLASTKEENEIIIDACRILIEQTKMYILNCTISKEAVIKAYEKIYS